ncbi:ribonuclease III [Candidatus Adlerbacteria bacterium RIFCSPHIGHO2_02_FULL_54_18]|uniref:Ribonuclease 3 n=2 Tax=Candidatus Adleribacteriota TaxID=1752736 RepID=A0A1F4Y3V5_9BACT|nr:MAG: ribonuclease III [Candidatus Adlerbacteria bacterium RIFCSPLOWO2_01_FULL_54_21b]OGC88655.1 MAG: ribonuclease III [Candidatus Adlerbacteria bacterium RIFCSPHIGHO2_02_FULL_54_18]
MPKDFQTFQQAIGVEFNDLNLLRQAFTHRSYLNEHRDESVGHNERLEFLGDAVLELIATHFLYQKFPAEAEGDLTAYRAALVNAVTCAEVAQDIGMNDFLLLSRGEQKDTGRARSILLANAFEALVGALYLDQGYEAAQKFITAHLFPKIDEIIRRKLWQDAKSALQEKAQEREGITPHYTVLRETGPDHDKHFVVGVYIKDTLLAQGDGKSKQEAEQSAARAALDKKGW